MTVGSDTLTFTYDASGRPLSVTLNGTTYYYVTNLQGDVTAILNTSGTAVVTYTYDAWGNPLATTGTLATTLGTLNPLRYRGYVYDTETELYYLQSRYYDPQIGRFLDADSFTSTGQGLLSNNMFAYCLNNPIAFSDSGGTAAKISLSAQTSIDDAPWRDASPGGGGRLPANYSHSVSYGSVEDKFFTVMLYKFITNADAEVAVKAEHFAYYNGVPIIKIPIGKEAFSLGFIILMGPDQNNPETVKHEYGHSVHYSQLGPVKYYKYAFLPSIVGYWSGVEYDVYFSQPWEYAADFFGQVSRKNYTYTDSAETWFWIYWLTTFQFLK